MKPLLLAITCGLVTLVAAPAFSQDKLADTMPILQEKLRADKKFVIANNLPLLEREAVQFWPIYDAYQAELESIDSRVALIILDYHDTDSAGRLDDTVARKLAERMLAVEDEEAALRHHYFAKLLEVLPPIKVARYLQIEGNLRAAKRYEVSSRIPLVEDRKPAPDGPSSGI